MKPSSVANGSAFERAAFASELTEGAMRIVIIAANSAFVAVSLAAVVGAADELAMRTWLVTLTLAAVSYVALRLAPWRLVAAETAWLAGLAAVTVLALFLFGRREIALILTVEPLMAVVVLGWQAGLVAEVSVTLLVWCLSCTLLPDLVPLEYVPFTAAGGAFVGLVGWAASQSLRTVTQWSFQSYRQAWQHMEDARQRRAQLARVVKDLDLAYYRLERTNAALIAAWQAAAKAEQFRTEFATHLSHELRTPLSLIIGFCEMMVTAPEKYGGIAVPGPYRSDLNAVYTNAKHLMALVNDVLDMAQLDAGRLALTRSEMDLAAVVDQAVDMVRDYVQAKGLALQVSIAPAVPRLWADPLRIRQVLLNLLVNAARFTERGHIQVEARCSEQDVMVRVADTGRGIPENEIRHVFEEFREANPQPATGWASSGLGLPISKRFVELHGGRMGVESVYLRGTTFWFTLPCQAPQQSDGQPPRLLPARPLEPSDTVKPAVVCVHDDAAARSLLQRHLTGCRVIGATDLEEGVSLANALRAVALVTEQNEAPSGLDVHTLAIHCPLPSARHTARLVGARDYLLKPFSAQELWAAIDSLGLAVQRVLVADDDPDMVRLVRRMLTPRVAPRDCLEATNGDEALRLMRDEGPDVVLLDLAMPEVDGYQVLARKAADSALADLPVIIISAKDDERIEVGLAGPVTLHRGRNWRLEELVRLLEAMAAALSRT